MDGLPCFRIGGDRHNYLQVEVLRHSHPGLADFWDGNWLDAKVKIEAGGFKGSYSALLRSEDVLHFLNRLSAVYASSGGANPIHTAEFATMKEQLGIVVKGDALGHFTADCAAVDNFSDGNRLEFELSFDQTDIPAILDGLQRITKAFPVRGSSSG